MDNLTKHLKKQEQDNQNDDIIIEFPDENIEVLSDFDEDDFLILCENDG